MNTAQLSYLLKTAEGLPVHEKARGLPSVNVDLPVAPIPYPRLQGAGGGAIAGGITGLGLATSLGSLGYLGEALRGSRAKSSIGKALEKSLRPLWDHSGRVAVASAAAGAILGGIFASKYQVLDPSSGQALTLEFSPDTDLERRTKAQAYEQGLISSKR